MQIIFQSQTKGCLCVCKNMNALLSIENKLEKYIFKAIIIFLTNKLLCITNIISDLCTEIFFEKF